MKELLMKPLKTTIFNNCPGGVCDIIRDYNYLLLAVLFIDLFIFLLTLFPPVFSWSKKKPDGKKRILFALFACVTFYFWLVFLVFNSIYCFGFLAHEGPCSVANHTDVNVTTTTPATIDVNGREVFKTIAKHFTFKFHMHFLQLNIVQKWRYLGDLPVAPNFPGQSCQCID
jgi:hypothetical protein